MSDKEKHSQFTEGYEISVFPPDHDYISYWGDEDKPYNSSDLTPFLGKSDVHDEKGMNIIEIK